MIPRFIRKNRGENELRILCAEIYKTRNKVAKSRVYEPFHDGGRYHIETRPLICGTNQLTGFYMITASVMKELRTLGGRLD